MTHRDYSSSPCVGICTTLFDEVCKGCGRTATEVSHWVLMTNEEKEIVWQRLEKNKS